MGELYLGTVCNINHTDKSLCEGDYDSPNTGAFGWRSTFPDWPPRHRHCSQYGRQSRPARRSAANRSSGHHRRPHGWCNDNRGGTLLAGCAKPVPTSSCRHIPIEQNVSPQRSLTPLLHNGRLLAVRRLRRTLQDRLPLLQVPQAWPSCNRPPLNTNLSGIPRTQEISTST